MKFSGFIHFGATENSANFDFLMKTAHFQQFFKIFFMTTLFIKLCNAHQFVRYDLYFKILLVATHPS
jgi:hypothetical protein